MSNFCITQGKGFQMTFANGYVISVQWGYGNYCSNRRGIYGSEKENDFHKCNTAEIACWKHSDDPQDKRSLISIVPHDQVIGWLDTNQVLEWINKVANATCDEDLAVECEDSKCYCKTDEGE